MVSKVVYYERAGVFDRMLILLLICIVVVVLNMKRSCPACKDNLRATGAVPDINTPRQSHSQADWHSSESIKDRYSNSNEGGMESAGESKTNRKLNKNHKKKKNRNLHNGNNSWKEKNWKDSWKDKNKHIIKQRKMERGSTLAGGIPADTLWVNKHDVVHIMTTRYMQHQPDLIHLGKARNDLFKTFTLPSVVAQTTQEFIWIIFTDPSLNQEVLNELVELIKPYKNILLIGTERSGIMINFRNKKWLESIKKVFSGDRQLLEDYSEASKSRVLLETRIDADDSIFVEMIDAVQKQAADTMGVRAKELNYDIDRVAKEYRIFCTEYHLEWGYFNPWDKQSPKGHIFGIEHKEFCISAGLTYGYQIGTGKKDLPTYSHNKIDKKITACSQSPENQNCVDRIDARGYKYIMLRSRTPTSAGMLGVIPTEEVVKSEKWKNSQDWAWKDVIEKNFAIKPESIFSLRQRLKADMVNVLTDALQGQCTAKEFTCKENTQRDLKNLLEEVKEHS